jgi:IclR family pca regulon transcriptional regulator
MLAHLPDDELKRYLETVKLRAYTDRTVVSSKRLKEILPVLLKGSEELSILLP